MDLHRVLVLRPGPGRAAGDFAARLHAGHKRAEKLHHPPGRLRLRKLRGKELAIKPGTSRRYHIPADAARAITARLTLRDQVITPILAGVRRPGPGRPLT